MGMIIFLVCVYSLIGAYLFFSHFIECNTVGINPFHGSDILCIIASLLCGVFSTLFIVIILGVTIFARFFGPKETNGNVVEDEEEKDEKDSEK